MSLAQAPFTPLHAGFCRSAARFPGRVAVEDTAGQSITYGELDRLTDDLRDHLAALGIGRGDRVGICLYKSLDSVAALLAILKVGAAYVPVDPTAPATRNAYVFANCSVKTVVVEQVLAENLQAELTAQGAAIGLSVVDREHSAVPVRGLLDGAPARRAVATVDSKPEELAYILYTSGSTGKPKGVMLTHRSATRFVHWCVDTFEPTSDDRFSSHAPFHFDLSILDIYTPFEAGATLVLVSEDLGKDPQQLARFIADRRLTVWYSTPSILSMLAQFGKMEQYDYRALRTVLFAGEVFPVGHLRALEQLWPDPRYFNLYGPTETNVCTWYELPPQIEPDRTEPYPIGKVCAHYRALVVDADDQEVERGGEGELLIAGDGVMAGYWSLPELTASAFADLKDRGRWYRTGDLVVEAPDGNLIFHGRKDRMVKKRGYRVELGEIEACLYQHPNVREAAVVAVARDDTGLILRAHVSTKDGQRISVIALKQFCSQRVPLYMVPDVFEFHPVLPKTTTDKIDYQNLKSR